MTVRLLERFVVDGTYSLVPGPEDQTKPVSSVTLQTFVELPAANVAASFLAFPNMRLLRPPEPDWWAWKARWEVGADWLELAFSLFDELEEVWGGSHVVADCHSTVLLDLLRHMNKRCRGIWLHTPDCTMVSHLHLSSA